jgi:hypothetical protein
LRGLRLGRVAGAALALNVALCVTAAWADGISGTAGGAVGLWANNVEALHITSAGLVGIGSTAPVVSLDDSQNHDAIALPGGSNAQRPTGTSLVNGEIRYNNTGTGQVEAYYNGAWNSLVTSATLGTSTPAAGSTGYVQFNNGGYLGANSNFYWDNTNGRLGIGTTSPASALQIGGGQVSLPAGTSSAPSYSFNGQLGIGMYLSPNTRIMFSGVGGVMDALAVSYDGVFLRTDFLLGWTDRRTADDGASIVDTTLSRGAAGKVYIGTSGTGSGGTLIAGNVGIGTTSPNAKLDVNSTSIIIEQSNTPADNATCTAGTIWWDANYIYVCTASGTVKRAALSTF